MPARVWCPLNGLSGLHGIKFLKILVLAPLYQQVGLTTCPRPSIILSVEEEMFNIFPLDESRILNVNIFSIRSRMILFQALYLLIREDLMLVIFAMGKNKVLLCLNSRGLGIPS